MKTKTLTVASVVALIGALGANARPIVDAGQAAWTFFRDALAGAPLGVASFVLSLGLAVASQPYLHKLARQLPCAQSRDFLVETAALVIGVGTLWLQMQHLGGVERLYALLAGMFAGFVAPYIYKGLAAAWRAGSAAWRGMSDQP